MKRSIRAYVRTRAERRCEYCRLREEDVRVVSFHLEHIIAKKHRGTDDLENLAWSCHFCNFAKSSNLSGRDPTTGRIATLFHPRRQRWRTHFEWAGPTLRGKTSTGRATVEVLNINADYRLSLRGLLILEGRFPPE